MYIYHTSEIGDLLFYLMTHYEDTDVRDKARFYYMLITSSTDEKVRVVALVYTLTV